MSRPNIPTTIKLSDIPVIGTINSPERKNTRIKTKILVTITGLILKFLVLSFQIKLNKPTAITERRAGISAKPTQGFSFSISTKIDKKTPMITYLAISSILFFVNPRMFRKF